MFPLYKYARFSVFQTIEKRRFSPPLLLLIICAPVVKILFLAVMLQCISAIVGLFGNTGVAILLERICEACMMLVKTMFTAVAVFMIIIALVCVAV